MNKLSLFIIWLGEFVENPSTGKPSVKRVGLALAVTAICVIMMALGAVVAYSIYTEQGRDRVDMVRSSLDTLEILAAAVLTAVTTGYLVDKASTRKSENEDDQ